MAHSSIAVLQYESQYSKDEQDSHETFFNTWLIGIMQVENQQDAEKVRQRRSHFAQRLNVPKQRTPRLFARCGLAGRPF
jgi:hypothetical protein